MPSTVTEYLDINKLLFTLAFEVLLQQDRFLLIIIF